MCVAQPQRSVTSPIGYASLVVRTVQAPAGPPSVDEQSHEPGAAGGGGGAWPPPQMQQSSLAAKSLSS